MVNETVDTQINRVPIAPVEVLPGVRIAPQVVETDLGPVEFDLTPGDGPVVLASGGVGGVRASRLQVGWLDPNRYRLLSVSRPGYGGTPLASGPGVEQQADLFVALLDRLRIERTAVVTVSAGGPAGYQLALRHPHRVVALIAIDSVSGRHDVPETAVPLAQAIFMNSSTQWLFGALARRSPTWMLRAILRDTGYYTKSQLRAHLDFTLASPEALAFGRGLLGAFFPYRPSKAGSDNDTAVSRGLAPLPLEGIECPALIIHGTHDADVKFHHGVYAYEQIAGAERIWIEEGSHLGFWLSPRAGGAQDAARTFLDRYRPW